VAGAETVFNARALSEGEEGDDEVVRMGDGVDMDRVMVQRRLVGEVDDGLRTCR